MCILLLTTFGVVEWFSETILQNLTFSMASLADQQRLLREQVKNVTGATAHRVDTYLNRVLASLQTRLEQRFVSIETALRQLASQSTGDVRRPAPDPPTTKPTSLTGAPASTVSPQSSCLGLECPWQLNRAHVGMAVHESATFSYMYLKYDYAVDSLVYYYAHMGAVFP